MAEFEFEATASDVPPPPPTTIYTLGFDEETVQQALAKTDGNEELAIDLILSGEARGAVAASTFQATVADDFGHAAHAANFSAPAFGLGSAKAASNLSFSNSFVYLHFTMGFDEKIVRQALSIADGNEELALDLILNGDIHAPEAQPEAQQSTQILPALSCADHLTGRPDALLPLYADGRWFSPAELLAKIKCPLPLLQAASWFFARRSPAICHKRYRQESLPPLGCLSVEYSSRILVCLMLGFVATACQRLVTAPASMLVSGRKTWLWPGRVMDRVTRGRVMKVQVWMQRRACCALPHACASFSLHLTALCICRVLQQTLDSFWVSRSPSPVHQARRCIHPAFVGCCSRPRCSRPRHLDFGRKGRQRAGSVPSDYWCRRD